MLFSNSRKYCGRQYGRYTIIKCIGEGRYGRYFLACDDKGATIGIKQFKPDTLKKNKKKNFYEAVILSQLSNAAIPEFLGVINEKRFYGFVLELKQGCTIKEYIFDYGHKFDEVEFFNIGLQLINIIKYIHKKGVVHRDIRISNVLICKGQISLIDFGLSRWAGVDKYSFDMDFSYLGDFLLYLLYSNFEKKRKFKKSPWYKELQLVSEQKIFIKKLLGLESKYKDIDSVEKEFIEAFKVNNLRGEV